MFTHKNIFNNVLWALVGKIGNMLGALFIGILVARYLGPLQYGLMNYVISYVTIFTIIASFGLDDIEIREFSKKPDRYQKVLGTSLTVRFSFAVLAYILICGSLWIFKSDTNTVILVLSYATIVFSGIFNVIRNYFTSILWNEYIVKSELLRTVIGILIKILLLWFKAPLILFVVATSFDTFLVASGYLYSYTHKIGSIREWRFDKQMVPFLLKESYPLVLSGAAVIIYQRIDQVMLGNMLNDEAVGYFATADKFLGVVLFLPMILVQTITPVLIRIREDSPQLYELRKQQFMNMIIWLSVGAALLVSLFAYRLIYHTFGEQYLAAVPILQIMSWKTVGMALSVSSGQIIIIERKQKWVVFRNIVGCLTCVIGNLLFIPKYGVIGSAWVTIITVFISGCFSHIFMPQYWKIFRMQLHALFVGWVSIAYIKVLLKNKK